MHRGYQYLFSFFLLSAALAAPSAGRAAAQPQDNGRQEDRHRDEKDRNRVYDREHKDYHNWDDNENKRWGLYLQENHLKEHDFKKATRKEQSEYWKWRHDHPDADDRH